jgi:curved DNA-binding protein CbpA
MKNYYQILGVSPDAEAAVIRAAYKALAQKYHPDKFSGSPAEAQARMSEINGAYAVLSDPKNRAEYDAVMNSEAKDTDQPHSAESNIDKDKWQIACEFYPDLDEITERLFLIDSSLPQVFKAKLIDGQNYEQRYEIAKQIENDYLASFFGDRAEIVAFARELLLAGKRQAARDLNEVIRVMGDSVTDERLIEQIETKHWPDRTAKRKAEANRKAAEEEAKRKAIEKAVETNRWIFLVALIFVIFLIGFRVVDSLDIRSVKSSTSDSLVTELLRSNAPDDSFYSSEDALRSLRESRK